jgi:hypothetical protein
MKSLFFILTMLVSLAVTSSTSFGASSLEARGRLKACCASYYTSVDGIITLHYSNDALPPGSQVFLRHGYDIADFVEGELQLRNSWYDLEVLPVPAITPSEWEIEFSKTLYWRSSSFHLIALDFVLEVHLPNGDMFFEKGSDTTFGYYRAELPHANDACNPFGAAGCVMKILTVPAWN